MSTLGRILWRFLVMAVAFFIAAIAATLISAGGVMAVDGPPTLTEPPLEALGKIMLLGLAGASVIGILAGPVALVIALVGEAFRLRSWVYYAIGGGLASIGGMAMSGFERFGHDSGAAIVAAGLVGGLVYWLIAGRSAGFLRETPA